MQAEFKPLPSSHKRVKLAISRHTPVFCVYCEKVNLPDEEAYKTCSKCMSVRYCSQEHQVMHWSMHKAICQTQADLLRSRSSSSSSHTNSLLPERPSIPQRIQIEDFVRLHHYILSRVLFTAAFSTRSRYSRKPTKPIKCDFDFQTQMAVITLSPRPESNPAKVFSLVGIQFQSIPEEGTELGDKIAPLRSGMMKADAEDRRKHDYAGVLLCIYDIPEWNFHWISPRSLFNSDLYTTPNVDWWKVGKFYLEMGVVYRLVPARTVGGRFGKDRTQGMTSEEKEKIRWSPGTLVKTKAKWVWMEASFDSVKGELE